MSEDNAFFLSRKSANPLLQRLSERLPFYCLGIRSARTPEIARIARAAGNHGVWIDLEHSTMPIDVAAQIACAALDLGLLPVVRIPEREYGVIGRLLDGGAASIIAPRIETVEQAADFAAACRFPPHGQRSAIGTLPYFELRRLPAAEMTEAANRAITVQVLIETRRGIENLEGIAAVPGVDLIALGVNDLSAELGVPGDARHPLVRAALDAAIAAGRKSGKPVAIGGLGDIGYAAELIDAGAAPYIFTGIDTDLLLATATARLQADQAALAARGIAG